jgi:hypothetical protein
MFIMECSIVRKITMAVCFPPGIKEWIKKKADADGLSMSSFLTQLVSKAMREDAAHDN